MNWPNCDCQGCKDEISARLKKRYAVDRGGRTQMMDKAEIEEIAARAKQEPGQEDWILFDPDTVRHLSADLLAALKENEALREALERIERVANGEDQVAECDTEGLEHVRQTARAALAGAGKET